MLIDHKIQKMIENQNNKTYKTYITVNINIHHLINIAKQRFEMLGLIIIFSKAYKGMRLHVLKSEKHFWWRNRTLNWRDWQASRKYVGFKKKRKKKLGDSTSQKHMRSFVRREWVVAQPETKLPFKARDKPSISFRSERS